jgi:aminopeptidase N
LHAHVTPATHGFSAEGKVTLRNDSQLPQKNVTLQISSTLEWKSIRVGDNEVVFSSQTYQSDVDHTGAVNEAVVTLPAAIAPKQTVELEVSYEGEIPSDSTRLTRIGTPEKIALENDWDQVSPEFTAVRGVGYVCWYPVSMEPANLSEGNRYFDVIGEWKQRNTGATMKLSIEVAGAANIIANGRLIGTSAHAASDPEQPATRVSEYSFAPIGFYPPTFAAGDFTTVDRPAIAVSYLPDHNAAAEEFALGAEKILPAITEWFGPAREKVRVVELADANAMPFDSGAMVFTPLRTSDSRRVEVQIAHQIAHACLPAGTARLWISEGLAQFAQALVRERQNGRKSALAWMNAFIPALASAEEQAFAPEPKSAPEVRTGQPLTRATDPAYYSIKAMFAWWMLRDMIGDDALGRAIRAYNPAQDKEPATMQRLIEAQAKRDLEWFFDDWVYRDRGLPDFTIETAFTRAMLTEGSATPAVSATITIANLGEATAEVPLLIHTEKGDVSARVLVKGKSKTVYHMQLPAQPTSATVNDGSVPEANVSNNTYTFGKTE